MSERTHRGKFVAASRAKVVLVGLLVIAALPSRGQSQESAAVTSAPAAATAPANAPPAASKPAVPSDKRAHFIVQFAAGAGIRLLPIAAGGFTMSSPPTEDGHSAHESPQTEVRFTQGFWRGRTPVTHGQYQTLMGANPSKFTAAGLDAPVDEVSWAEALAFCQKLNERERTAGRLPAGFTFTLPTEAQWEYACRAGTTGPFAGDLAAMAWDRDNSDGTTHATGAKLPNAWGLCDMHGNVWEKPSWRA